MMKYNKYLNEFVSWFRSPSEIVVPFIFMAAYLFLLKRLVLLMRDSFVFLKREKTRKLFITSQFLTSPFFLCVRFLFWQINRRLRRP